jgi:hypothetical protein
MEVLEQKLEQKVKAAEGATMPDGTLHIGRYVTPQFEPALSFSLSDTWRLNYPETANSLSLEGPGGNLLEFTASPFNVVTPDKPDEMPVPGPEDAEEWASWFQSHPSLVTSNSGPRNIGSASGRRIDVTGVTPEADLQGCIRPGSRLVITCVSLYYSGPVYEAPPMSYRVDWKHRFVMVDVKGETVVIGVSAPADKFDEFLPKAQKILDSIEWKYG